MKIKVKTIIFIISIFICNIGSLKSFAQLVLYQKNSEVGVYSVKEKYCYSIANNTSLLDGYEIKNGFLFLYFISDTLEYKLKNEWEIPAVFPSPIKYVQGNLNIIQIEKELFIIEDHWNIILCNDNKRLWIVKGNKGRKAPSCDRFIQKRVSVNKNFNPVFSVDNQYMVYQSYGPGFLGFSKIWLIVMSSGNKKMLVKGFNPSFSPTSHYLLYQSDMKGKFNIVDVSTGSIYVKNFNNAFWLSF